MSFFKRKKNKPFCPYIYVSEQAMATDSDSYDPMMDVVDYTNAVMHEALYKTDEFPKEAYWLYNADYYISQVNNGGHSQYLNNDRNSGASESSLPLALAGLELVKCEPIAECLRDLKKWAKKNPAEARAQNGFTHRADALEVLDKRLYELGSDIFYNAVREWLQNSDVVRILPEEAGGKVFEAIKENNFLSESRQRTQFIASLDAGLTTDTSAPYRACVAGYLTKNRFFEVQAVLGGAPSEIMRGNGIEEDFAHPDNMLWNLQTNTGPLHGQTVNGKVHIFKLDEKNKEAGIVFECPLERAEQQIKIASALKPGRYAVDLVKRFTPDDPPAFLSFIETDISARDLNFFGVTTKSGEQYKLGVTDVSAGLFTWQDHEGIVKIVGREFKALRKEDHSRLT